MNLEQKIDLFTQRLAREPHSRLFAPLADLLRQAGRPEDSLELLEDGLGRHPDYVSALVIKGRTLLETGRLDLARQVLYQVLDLDPENFVVLRLLAEDARGRLAWEEAIPLLEKLVVLDPDDDRWPGALVEAKQFAARVASAGSAGSSFATLTLVDIYLAQGYRAKALEALDQMAAREPDRQDIRQRITEITAEGPSVPPGLASRIPSVKTFDDSSGATGGDRAAWRSSEKKQFEEWIDRIRQDGGSSS